MLAPLAWLYVQADESIRIRQSADGLMLLVCGPGPAEHAHVFDSRGTLEQFLRWYTATLARDGWTLATVPDRRRALTETKELSHTDRRRCDPGTLWFGRFQLKV